MIYIHKGNVPFEFLKAKKNFNHYDNLPHDIKEHLKLLLIEEQGEICAYCMGRIKPENSTIEHYIPRNGENGDPDKSLDYNNLLAVCTNERNDKCRDRQCDVSRGNTKLHINPCNEIDMQTICYKTNGEIYTDREDFNTDLTTTLNLNNMTLKNNRKAAFTIALQNMSKKNKGNWKKEYVKKWLDFYNNQDKKTEYVGIITFELEKRLKRST